ncbi:MAG: cell division protein ZipA [Motiliproteus sp.]|jgi:cell division protein ZipA
MSIREGLITAGIVILVIVLGDLIRRYLQRNKLRMAIDKQFKDFPEADLSSELPNGGARAREIGEQLPWQTAARGVKPSRKEAKASRKEAKAGKTETCAEAWVIDPQLSGTREPDAEVDLLLELEFKGLGQGASRWMSQTGAEPSNRKPDAADSAAVEAAGRTEPKAAEAEQIDLERPVHELLQARQQATASSDVDTQTPPGTVGAVPEHREEQGAVKVQKQAHSSDSDAVAGAEAASSTPAEKPFDLCDSGPDPDVALSAADSTSRKRSKKAPQPNAAPSVAQAPAETPFEDEVLIINVQAKRMPFAGAPLFKLVEACGMEFGERGIYHRYEQSNGRGAMQFSMANAVQPGSFDPDASSPWSTPAVTFFLCLADPIERMNALECMLATAKCVADNLGGDLKDEHRSSLRTQTIEHYRQKVREFERKALTRGR